MNDELGMMWSQTLSRSEIWNSKKVGVEKKGRERESDFKLGRAYI